MTYRGCEWTANLAALNNWDKHNEMVLVFHDLEFVSVSGPMPDGDPNTQLQQILFRPILRVALPDGKPLLETLADIASGVSNVIDAFAGEFPREPAEGHE